MVKEKYKVSLIQNSFITMFQMNLLFTICSSKLFEVIKDHLPVAHAYANDSQLYLSFKPNSSSSQSEAIEGMELCLKAIRAWMITDKLKLNDDETEFLIIGTRQQLSKVHIKKLSVGDVSVTPATVARNPKNLV